MLFVNETGKDCREIIEKLSLTESVCPPGSGAYLKMTPEGLALCDGKLSMTGDFSSVMKRTKPQNLRSELLIRAASVKGVENPKVLDATAGMGEDSFLLAAAGFEVLLCEYDPIIAALLSDTMERTKCETVGRMTLENVDSIIKMKENVGKYDVIYLDPMFPERTKSALVGKKFQLIHQLEAPCTNETDLLKAAVLARPKKIVIKRPLKGAELGGITPDYSLSGKAVRYDVLINVEQKERYFG